jgi:hypothetical protein
MPPLVCNGATLNCSFGLAPAVLSVAPSSRVMAPGQQPAASIQDHQPLVNIGSFGMCTSLANPAVAAATSAALGVLTPQPCVPVTPAPWSTGAATVQVGGQPALDSSGQCLCTWAGVITIASAGQATVNVP